MKRHPYRRLVIRVCVTIAYAANTFLVRQQDKWQAQDAARGDRPEEQAFKELIRHSQEIGLYEDGEQA